MGVRGISSSGGRRRFPPSNRIILKGCCQSIISHDRRKEAAKSPPPSSFLLFYRSWKKAPQTVSPLPSKTEWKKLRKILTVPFSPSPDFSQPHAREKKKDVEDRRDANLFLPPLDAKSRAKKNNFAAEPRSAQERRPFRPSH